MYLSKPCEYCGGRLEILDEPTGNFKCDTCNTEYLNAEEIKPEYYTISRDRLRELLTQEYRLAVLERDGVDNWSWYMESRREYIAEGLGISAEEVQEKDYDFEDLAELDMKGFDPA